VEFASRPALPHSIISRRKKNNKLTDQARPTSSWAARCTVRLLCRAWFFDHSMFPVVFSSLYSETVPSFPSVRFECRSTELLNNRFTGCDGSIRSSLRHGGSKRF